MEIVEGIARDCDRWERASAGLPPAPAGSTSKVSGLLSLRAFHPHNIVRRPVVVPENRQSRAQ
jgi:hypothetical protein